MVVGGVGKGQRRGRYHLSTVLMYMILKQLSFKDVDNLKTIFIKFNEIEALKYSNSKETLTPSWC